MPPRSRAVEETTIAAPAFYPARGSRPRAIMPRGDSYHYSWASFPSATALTASLSPFLESIAAILDSQCLGEASSWNSNRWRGVEGPRAVQRIGGTSLAASPPIGFDRQGLPPPPSKPKVFPSLAKGAYGAFTLLDEHTMLASPSARAHSRTASSSLWRIRKARQQGLPQLWEAFSLTVGCNPRRKMHRRWRVPGGWTWALASLGAEVLAITGRTWTRE